MKRSKSFVSVILGLLFLVNVLAWIEVYNLTQSQVLEVTFFDIGQGDSIFIQTPQKHQILIDGGPDSTILEKLAEEMPFWDRTIDLIILTHPEHDHVAGLLEVLRRYKVEQILWTGIKRDTAEYRKWQELIKKEETEGAKIFIAQSNQRILTRNVLVNILSPFENLEGQEVKNTNNSSIIARLVFGNNTFLFTGDAYKSVERELIERDITLNSDVLKVGHHGSKTSSSEEFIQAVSPEIAVIQCGKDNPYGHPYPETLATLEKFGIKILRTDQNGDVKIISDRNNLKF
ncbi:MBL fold metallo-hydrolase [Candidatus Parcubacteria bacterium]|nr:MBL fold metallo-hydrolase [Candidatus Parcubacteria bacterium]